MTVAAPALRFVEADHSYWVGDRRIPSVTKIMKPLQDFSFIPPGVLAAKAALGTAVHFATELYDEDDLDWSSLTEAQEPYVRAWAKFREQNAVEIVSSEERVYHDQLGYAGQLDRTAIIGAQYGLLDIKTVAVMTPVVGVQTAAYLEAWKRTHRDTPPPTVRWGVQLKPDGTYRFCTYTSPKDFGVFCACLTIHNWLEANP